MGGGYTLFAYVYSFFFWGGGMGWSNLTTFLAILHNGLVPARSQWGHHHHRTVGRSQRLQWRCLRGYKPRGCVFGGKVGQKAICFTEGTTIISQTCLNIFYFCWFKVSKCLIGLGEDIIMTHVMLSVSNFPKSDLVSLCFHWDGHQIKTQTMRHLLRCSIL